MKLVQKILFIRHVLPLLINILVAILGVATVDGAYNIPVKIQDALPANACSDDSERLAFDLITLVHQEKVCRSSVWPHWLFSMLYGPL